MVVVIVLRRWGDGSSISTLLDFVEALSLSSAHSQPISQSQPSRLFFSQPARRPRG